MGVSGSKIAVVGCGPGAADYVTDAARQATAGADVLFGSPRLLALFEGHPGEKVAVDGRIDELLARIGDHRRQGQDVAVLVSGDPGLCSLAENIVRCFGRENCRLVPAVSSVQVAFARLGLAWSDARIVSAHGRTPAATIAELAECDKLVILGGTQDAAVWLANLARSLSGSHAAFLCRNLTLEDELVCEVSPEEIESRGADALSLLVLVRRALL